MDKILTFSEYLNLNESIADKGILKAVFVTGIPGAGKSYVLEKLPGVISPKIINTDDYNMFLCKTLNIEMSDSLAWSRIGPQTKKLSKSATYQYINSMLPLLIDMTTNNGRRISNRISILKSLGYDIGFVNVITPLDTAIKRVEERSKKENRNVDLSYIETAYKKNTEYSKFFKSKVNFYKEINNGEGELNDKALLNIYKQIQSFYNEPVQNSIGKSILEKMKLENKKYLSDIIDKDLIQSKTSKWYDLKLN